MPKNENHDDLFALSLRDASIICPSCAHDKYPDGDYPEDSTPVFNYDDWKASVSGVCTTCKTLVGVDDEDIEDLGGDDNENHDDDGNVDE